MLARLLGKPKSSGKRWLDQILLGVFLASITIGGWSLNAQDQASVGQVTEQIKEIKETKETPAKVQGEQKSKADTEKWTVKLGGHVQMDYVLWANAPDSIPNTNNYVNFRRLRVVADGTGYDNCDFRVQMTL